jgi:hypothetical protein
MYAYSMCRMARLYSLHGTLSSEKHRWLRGVRSRVRNGLHPSRNRGQCDKIEDAREIICT